MINDPTLVCLAHVIQQGWPENMRYLYSDIKPYFPYCYELHILDGIIILQNRIVVHIGLCHAFHDKIHDSHMPNIQTTSVVEVL